MQQIPFIDLFKSAQLWEMMDNKIPNYLLNTIKSIYRNTKIRIKFNDDISEPMHINK
jgi:hypothetical protein